MLHDVLRQFADAIEAASEGEVGVVEVDLLVVLRLPMSELRHGLGGDHVWLEELELPLGLVVLVLQVVEQHVHLCEVGSGDRLLVQLLGVNTVQMIAHVGPLGRKEHVLCIWQSPLMKARYHLRAILGEDGVVLLDELDLPRVVEAVHPRTLIEHHRTHTYDVHQRVATAEGHGGVGAVIELPGMSRRASRAAICASLISLKKCEEPEYLHLRWTREQVLGLL
jgi:hypothetical protein